MFRVKLAVIIMLTIATTSGITTFVVERNFKGIEQRIETVKTSVENNETEEAVQYAEELESYWKKVNKMSSLFLRCNKISAIQTSINKIKPMILSQSDELMAEIANLQINVKDAYEEERPLPRHIF
jgi:protein subunit release factor A